MKLKAVSHFRSILRYALFFYPVRVFIHAFLSSEMANRPRRAIEKRRHYGLLAVLSTGQSPRGYVYESSNSVIDRYWHRVSPISGSSDHSVPKIARRGLDEATLPTYLNRLVATSVRDELQHPGRDRQHRQSSRFQHSSKPQRTYDDLHKVQCRNGIFFATRGNRSCPKKIVITLAETQTTESTIRYPVLHLGNISDVELSETLIVAVQPRTSEALEEDDSKSARSTASLVSLIRRVLKRTSTDDSSLLFVAEPGSSVSLTKLISEFPRAETVSLRNSLGDNSTNHAEMDFCNSCAGRGQNIPMTEQSLKATVPRDYILFADVNGRADLVHSTRDDDQSRQTLLFRFSVVPENLRVAAEPALFAVIRFILGLSQATEGAPISELRMYGAQVGRGIQIRVDVDQPYESERLWFLEFRTGVEVMYTDLTNHRLPFVKYTKESQYIPRHVLERYNLSGALSLGHSTGPSRHEVQLRLP